MSAYGYCPICGAEVATRERRIDGNDTCAAGHVYRSAYSLRTRALVAYVATVNETLATVFAYLDDTTRHPLSEQDCRNLAGQVKRSMRAIPYRKTDTTGGK
jgi:hypothetical protein